jgi:hypothetical protein
MCQAQADEQMETEDIQFSRVALPTRLDNRVLDLRVSRIFSPGPLATLSR